MVEFKKDMDERGRSYSWSTLPAELNVMAGLDDNIVIDESDLSLYRSLLSHIQATDRRVTGLIEQIGNITQPSVNLDLLNSQIADLQSNVDFIKESAAYIDGRQTKYIFPDFFVTNLEIYQLNNRESFSILISFTVYTPRSFNALL